MSESIGNLYPTQIPSLSETADIQEAFRLYHYGAPSGTGTGEYDPTNTNAANLVNPSIAYTLNNLQSQITTISGSLGVQATVWTTKGDLVTRTSSPGVVRFGVGADGTVLTANSATATGLEWGTLPVTLTNSVTLTNKTINLLNNTLTGTIAQFNTALSDGDFATLAGTETLTNKTLTSPTLTSAYVTNSITFEGPTVDDYEIVLTAQDSFLTSDITVTLPNISTTLVGTTTGDNLENKTLTNAKMIAWTNTYSGTPNTLILLDASKVVLVSHTTSTTLNVPTNASVAFPVGTQIMVIQSGAGQVTIAASSPGTTTINGTPGLKLRAQNSGAVLIKTATDVWYVVGDLAA